MHSYKCISFESRVLAFDPQQTCSYAESSVFAKSFGTTPTLDKRLFCRVPDIILSANFIVHGNHRFSGSDGCLLFQSNFVASRVKCHNGNMTCKSLHMWILLGSSNLSCDAYIKAYMSF